MCLDLWRDPSAIYHSGVMEDRVRERKTQLETPPLGFLKVGGQGRLTGLSFMH